MVKLLTDTRGINVKSVSISLHPTNHVVESDAPHPLLARENTRLAQNVTVPLFFITIMSIIQTIVVATRNVTTLFSSASLQQLHRLQFRNCLEKQIFPICAILFILLCKP